MTLSKPILKKFGIWCLAIGLFAAHILIRSVAHADAPMPSSAHNCRIMFPSSPQHVQQSIRLSAEGHTLVYDLYLAPLNNNTLCLLLVATYPSPLTPGNETAALEALLQGLLNHNPENTLAFANATSHKSHPALDFLIQSSNSYFRAFSVMVGNKLYLIAMEGHEVAPNEAQFSQFVKTFGLGN
ncbi:MAG: hypothetical protein KGJ02_02515 [Verrucomicrobiota bacterium]|nr:hypothetical protein [Verrucomicrobiota bacterium]